MSQPGNPDRDEDALRAFLARLLGYERAQDIEHALRSVQLAITYRAALVLIGDIPDLVTIAEALHRRTLGAGRPFVICDRHRWNERKSARYPVSYESGVAALEAARGGSLCVPRTGLPHDFPSMVAAVRDPAASVQLIVCGPVNHAEHPYLILPVPIQVPSIAARAADLSRIVDEYAQDAIATLDAFQRDYTDADRTWITDRYANTWGELEMTTMRLVAVRSAPSVAEAARRLGIKYATLRRWLHNHRVNSRGEVRP